MENESKRRSGSFGSQKAAKESGDEARKLSLSEGSIVDKSSNVSPGSSEAGTLKKPRKFKPRKFIAKRFKSKKSSDEQDQNTAESGQSEQESSKKSVASKISEKLNSPKLQRFNFVKRFSGKKSYKVSPMTGSLDDGIDESKLSLTKLESLSASESNIHKDVKTEVKEIADNTSEPSTEIVSFEEVEQEQEKLQLDVPADIASSSKETVTLESKKVQLKITISGKKVEKRNLPPLNAGLVKASPIQTTQTRTDIILPSTSTQVRLSTGRDPFFTVPPPPPIESAKPINNHSANEPVTFATVVKEGLSVQSAPSNSSTEVEKYLILTSSLNTIISAAKELDDLGKDYGGGRDFKFPQLPDLKIHEGTSETEVENIPQAKKSDLNAAENIVQNISQTKIVSQKFDAAEKDSHEIESPVGSKVTQTLEESEISKISRILATSTPTTKELVDDEETILETSTIEESDEMKKARKSKIPIDSKRLSTSSDGAEKDVIATVHTQEAHKPYHLNLSSSSSEESRNNTGAELKTDEIKFVVGTPVRPQRTSPALSTLVLAPLALPETPDASRVDESIDEIFHSPKSEQSFPSESMRRKIAYVPQLTIYTAEEQELLKSNFQANAVDSFDLSSLPADSSVFPVFDDSAENTMTSSLDKREHLYKILVIGELGTGKTSFIKRYVHQFFSQNYRATIGVDFALKVLNWDQSTIIRLQLWDIAGQERFGNMTRVYYKEAVGAFIVFDVTRSATFDAVIKWKQDLDTKVQLPDGSPIPCILLANKCDQQKQGLVTMNAKMDEYCKQNGFAGWFETSAKDNVNIEESAKALVSKILINDKLINNDCLDGDRLVLNAEDASNQKKKFCSC